MYPANSTLLVDSFNFYFVDEEHSDIYESLLSEEFDAHTDQSRYFSPSCSELQNNCINNSVTLSDQSLVAEQDWWNNRHLPYQQLPERHSVTKHSYKVITETRKASKEDLNCHNSIGRDQDIFCSADLLNSESVYLPVPGHDISRSPDLRQRTIRRRCHVTCAVQRSQEDTRKLVPSDLRQLCPSVGSRSPVLCSGSFYPWCDGIVSRAVSQATCRIPFHSSEVSDVRSSLHARAAGEMSVGVPFCGSSKSSSCGTIVRSQPSSSLDSVPTENVSLIHRVVDSKRQQHLHAANSQLSTTGTLKAKCRVLPPATVGLRSKIRLKTLGALRQAELSKLVMRQQHAEQLSRFQDMSQPQEPSSEDHPHPHSRCFIHSATDPRVANFNGEEQAAATLIQATWRGYWTREHNLYVASVRKEIRARRAEDHIVLLRAELERQQKLYKEERRLRTLQMEAIRCLYDEVQQLKGHAGSGGRPASADIPASPASGASSVTSCAIERTAVLERTCASLQEQVLELRQSVSAHMFGRHGGPSVHSPPTTPSYLDIPESLDAVQVLECHSEETMSGVSGTPDPVCQWTCIPNSLSPHYPEPDVSHVNSLNPPGNLSLQHRGPHSVLLQWRPSCIKLNVSVGTDSTELSYHVYVNDQRTGAVRWRTAALVTGLSPFGTYKFYIKAASDTVESYKSNIVIARWARGIIPQSPTDSSSTDMSRETDIISNTPASVVDNRWARKRHYPRPKVLLSTPQNTDARDVSGGCVYCRDNGNAGGDHLENGHQALEPVDPCEEAVKGGGIITQPLMHLHHCLPKGHQKESPPTPTISDVSESCCRVTNSNSVAPTAPLSGIAGHSLSSPLSIDSQKPTPSSDQTAQRDPNPQLCMPAVNQRRSGSPARDLSFKSGSPVFTARSSPGTEELPNEAGTPPLFQEESVMDAPVVLSDTFTVDKAKSFLLNLSAPFCPAALAKGVSLTGERIPHNRSQSDGSKDASRGAPCLADQHTPIIRSCVAAGGKHSACFPRYDASLDDEGGKGATHVLDGRRRPSSRSCSPMIFDGPLAISEHGWDTSDHARSLSSAENLMQRMCITRKSPSPSAVLANPEDGGVVGSPQCGGSASRKVLSVKDHKEGMPLSQRYRERDATSLLPPEKAGLRPARPLRMEGEEDTRAVGYCDDLCAVASCRESIVLLPQVGSGSSGGASVKPVSSVDSQDSSLQSCLSDQSAQPCSPVDGDKARSESPSDGRLKRSLIPEQPRHIFDRPLPSVDVGGVEASSPLPTLRSRSQSMGSESDLVGASSANRDKADIVSSLLTKLKVFCRDQHSVAFKERGFRLLKGLTDDGKGPQFFGRLRHVSDSENEGSSDTSGHLPPRVPIASDGSSGSPSDDNKVSRRRRRYRQHSRGFGSARADDRDQVWPHASHSPIIMAGGGRKAACDIKRNASFHSLLPFRPDTVATGTLEEAFAGSVSTGKNEEVICPKESHGSPTSSIYSRSPSPSGNRQPVLSGAMLRQLKS